MVVIPPLMAIQIFKQLKMTHLPPQSHINRDRGFTHQSNIPADGNATSKGNNRSTRSDDSVRSDISDFPQETGPDTEYLKSSYFPRESLYYDEYNTPVPQGVSAELPQCLTRFGNILGHPAIGGKTMAQFRIELDRPMPYGTAVGMTHILRSLITGLPDAGHGRPGPFSVDSLDWAG